MPGGGGGRGGGALFLLLRFPFLSTAEETRIIDAPGATFHIDREYLSRFISTPAMFLGNFYFGICVGCAFTFFRGGGEGTFYSSTRIFVWDKLVVFSSKMVGCTGILCG